MNQKLPLAIQQEQIKTKILTIRGIQVILDFNLATLYGTKTRILKQAVKRNISRFPEDFMFILNNQEIEYLVSQNVIPEKKLLGGANPYAFTEQGVANLSSVLRSKKAIEINIQIIRAFINMRRLLKEDSQISNRVEILEKKQVSFEIKTDKRFEKVFDYLETKSPKQGIFFEGQIFDAYEFVSGLVKSAKKEIILIDNYIDESVLTLFTKRKKSVKVIIFTQGRNKTLQLDLKKFGLQYGEIEIKKTKKFHDRFLIIDNENVFHFGASLKNLGEKCFAFSKFDKKFFNPSILKQL